MSTKQPTKRTASPKRQKEMDTVPKKMINVPAQKNNVEDQNGKVHADDQMPIIDTTANSRKLPDEVLQKFNNEPGQLLIAGNVAWNKSAEREELTVFHRLTDKTVSENDKN